VSSSLDARLDAVLASVLGLDAVPEDLAAERCAAWDSAAHLNIVFALEDGFGVTFTVEEIETATSRAALRAVLSAHRPAGAA